MKVKWSDIKVGDRFIDGSEVSQIHEVESLPCYKLIYRNRLFENKSIILSKDHFLLCDISQVNKNVKQNLLQIFKNHQLPLEGDCHVYSKAISEENKESIVEHLVSGKEIDENVKNSFITETIYTKHHDVIVSDSLMWLSVENIHWLLENGVKLYSNKHLFKKSYYCGEKEVRCVSTTTGSYTTCGLIHHNSVTLRNIIFHCLTHSYEWGLGLVDLKLTEFSQFKGVNGVVGVSNTVQETAELLRVAREVLYRRNRLLAEKGVTDIIDYKPEKPLDKIWISGREIHEDTKLKVKINGEEKEITAKELLELVNKN